MVEEVKLTESLPKADAAAHKESTESNTTSDGVTQEDATSTAPPATIALPLSFVNSFWTQDYRTGFEMLYKKLDAGIVENEEVVTMLKRRAMAERSMSMALMPHSMRPDGFGIDEGASLKMGLEAVLASSMSESRARQQLADEIHEMITEPFEHWSKAHKGRIRSSRALIESHLGAYEKKVSEVTRLRAQYDEACRTADQIEDELSFVKGTTPSHSAPSSPELSRQGSSSNKRLPVPEPVSKDSSVNGDDSSVDGVDSDDTEETMWNRSGSAGSITAALGRAWTIRKNKADTLTDRGVLVGNPTSSLRAKELPTAPPFTEDPNVAAAIDWTKTTFSSLREKMAGPQTAEQRLDFAKKHAEITEERYRAAIETLDGLRLQLEEALHEHFSYAHRCEQDRVLAGASVLRLFLASIAALPKSLAASQEKVGPALTLIRPDRDVLSIAERLRTGSFHPHPTTFHSRYSEPSSHNFGIDLRKFDETNSDKGIKVPLIFTFLLEYITAAYGKISDSDRRKAWIYETSLVAQHHLRSALNQPDHLRRSIVEKYDLPVVCGTLKLWLLELEVPVVVFSHYDEYRHLYPKRVGAERGGVPAKAIAAHVARLPPTHLEVLRLLVFHLSKLIETTKSVDDSDDIFVQKLSLSMAKCIMRPKEPGPLNMDDRFPALLFADLVKNCEEIFKSADELRDKQHDDRYRPRRTRTKPTDSRLSRTRLSEGGDSADGTINMDRAGEMLKAQRSPPPATLQTFQQPDPQKLKVESANGAISPESYSDETTDYQDAEEVPPPFAKEDQHSPPFLPSNPIERKGVSLSDPPVTSLAPPVGSTASPVKDGSPIQSKSPSLSRTPGITRSGGARGPRPLRSSQLAAFEPGKTPSSTSTNSTE